MNVGELTDVMEIDTKVPKFQVRQVTGYEYGVVCVYIDVGVGVVVVVVVMGGGGYICRLMYGVGEAMYRFWDFEGFLDNKDWVD